MVLELNRDDIQLSFFILPALVATFFGSLLVIIRRLRRDLQRQHLQIVGLNRHLSRDLKKSNHQLQTAHKELEHGERLRIIGLLGAQVAHDFNNLLTTIVWAASNVEPDASDAELNESRSLILDASDKAARLCSLLLGFGKPGDESVVTSLDVVLEEMEPILRKLVSRDVDFRIEEQANFLVAADRGRVEMCLLNLVINSNDCTS